MEERKHVTEEVERLKKHFNTDVVVVEGRKPSTLAHRILNLISRPRFNQGISDDKLRKIQHLLDRPYSCKFCGMPTDIPQEDQEKPRGYCQHE